MNGIFLVTIEKKHMAYNGSVLFLCINIVKVSTANFESMELNGKVIIDMTNLKKKRNRI